MSAHIIDGKLIAAECRQHLARQVESFRARHGFAPGLAVVLVGENPASQVYVRNKEHACREIGMVARQYDLPANTPEAQLLDLIKHLNNDSQIHGILVQLPLPKNLSADRVIQTIAPHKDVDGFHPENMGKLLIGHPALEPCTPKGVIHLLDSLPEKNWSGKQALVIGRSNIVGKPVALMLLKKNLTVTLAHSGTRDLPKLVGEADVLVAAIGKAHAIKGDWVKPGAVVIDVGINRLESGKLCGDVEFEAAEKRAGWITPVPGGVGPMTIAMLLTNTLQAAKDSQKC